MRNIVLTILCGLAVFALAYFGNFLKNLYITHEENLSPILNFQSPGPQANPNILDLNFDLDSYRIAWVETEAKNIELYTNLDDQKTGKKLQKEMNCTSLVNGGFYSKNDEHIGLFVSEGEEKQEQQSNRLFNGFFVIENDIAQIKEQTYTDTSRLAVQSGPVLIKDGILKAIVIQNDENDRRIIVATTDNNKVVFMTIYNKDSAYLGPKLAEVPKLVQEFGRVTRFNLVNALNLDGGTASAFYTNGVSLGELTKIGSYFCIK